MKKLNDKLKLVTEKIRKRSARSRSEYLSQIRKMGLDKDTDRGNIGCSNLAHAAASTDIDKLKILKGKIPNIAIISSYNDMLSAHKPFEKFPAMIKKAARGFGATAQVSSCVPAMCDGITQGRPGMELSLMSRDVIAMATAVGLSHNVYDGTICLGICDKIVPGMVIGSLSHGHLPMIFAPGGPMSTGISNEVKGNVRKEFAKKKVSRNKLLEVESKAYHGSGTCTFYGTANSNQMLMEIMGLQIPNSSFVHPNSDLRELLSVEAVKQIVAINLKSKEPRPLGEVVDERSFVNAIVGLHATGGSTNHMLHLPAMAAAAGIKLTWEDFEALSEVVPLLARVYPNGHADVNEFHNAGGMNFIFQELISEGLLDTSANTSWGKTLADFIQKPEVKQSKLTWTSLRVKSQDESILRTLEKPFMKSGGIKVLSGNLGKAVIKVSAVSENNLNISAKALIFSSQEEVKEAFNSGKLDRDVIVVVKGQGPKANGMPELHSLTPILGVLQEKGFKVALVTDGRMSGASGKIPAAIHLYPEAKEDGPISKLKDGDLIELNSETGVLRTDVDLNNRTSKTVSLDKTQGGFGRELFSVLRSNANCAEMGGGINMLEKTHGNE